MANRNFSRHQSLQKEVKSLHVSITTDGSGDVVSFKGVGVESVAHAANVYTIVLQDAYQRLLGISAMSSVAASYSVDNVDLSASAKSLEVESSAAQASTELHIVLDVKNSSVGE